MFLARHRSSGGVGFPDAVIIILTAYNWCISVIRRHRALHSTNGNTTLPESLRRKGISQHETNRALLCMSCDVYIGRQQWHGGTGKTTAIYLGDCADTLQKVQQQYVEYDFACVTVATSLCSTCRRNIKRACLHRQETAKRVTTTHSQRRPPCEQQPVGICRICQRVAEAMSAPPRKKKRTRRVLGDARLPTPKRGRPQAGLWSTRFPAGRSFSLGEPRSRSPPATQRRYSAEQFLRIGDAISHATSTRALRRVGAVMQQPGMPAKPPSYLQNLLRARNRFFNDDYITVPSTSDALPACHLRTSACDSKSWEGGEPPPCKHCQHPAVVPRDLVRLVTKYLNANDIALEEVALVRFGIDGGARSIKFMLQFLRHNDPLLTDDVAVHDAASAASFVKDSGVCRTLIIAALPAAPENFDNINFVLDLLAVEELMRTLSEAKLCVCADVKMILLLLGQRAAGAIYACPHCMFSRWPKHSHPSAARSIATISADSAAAAEHLAKGGKLKPGAFGSASGYRVARFLRSYNSTLEVLPMGELHITLGVVPQLFNELQRIDAELARDWLIKSGVMANDAHARADFVGPQCLRLLKSVPLLRKCISAVVAEKHLRAQSSKKEAPPVPLPHERMPMPNTPEEVQLRVLLLCDAFDAYSALHLAMTARRLAPNWHATLVTFVGVVEQLALKTTLKVHFLAAHSTEFLRNFAMGSSFAAFSEQVMESKHAVFALQTTRFNVPANFQRIDRTANESFRRAVVADAGSQIPAAKISAHVSAGRSGNAADCLVADGGVPGQQCGGSHHVRVMLL